MELIHIAAAVGVLGTFSDDPKNEHLTAAKRVLRYLKGTSELKLKLQPNSLELYGYADVNWAADIDSRKSTTGYIFKIGDSPSHGILSYSPLSLYLAVKQYMSLASAA